MDIQLQIHDYIKEYFRFCDLNSTFDTFEKELKDKSKSPSLPDSPLTQLFLNTTTKTKKELSLDKDFKASNKKYKQVLQASRQIFSVSINILQLMNSLRDVSKLDSMANTIQNYKIQLGKHYKIIINEGKLEGTELITEATIVEHKQKLEQNYLEGNKEGMIEFLLSLRVNALQIAPQLRRSLVTELVKRDIFKIHETQKFDFVLGILNINNKPLRQAITSLISVICSTLKGVDYITYNNNDAVLQKIFRILKEQKEPGNVTQRFCVAILQKCSLKQSLMPSFIEQDMFGWVIDLVSKSLSTKIHPFCLDLSTSMLFNMIQSRWCQSYLQKKADFTLKLMETMLQLLTQNLAVSIQMHLLFSLTLLNKKPFRKQIQACDLRNKITDFANKHSYSKFNDNDSEMAQADRKMVLELCSHMFHVKEEEEKGEKVEERREEEQGELIFECFQDEVA